MFPLDDQKRGKLQNIPKCCQFPFWIQKINHFDHRKRAFISSNSYLFPLFYLVSIWHRLYWWEISDICRLDQKKREKEIVQWFISSQFKKKFRDEKEKNCSQFHQRFRACFLYECRFGSIFLDTFGLAPKFCTKKMRKKCWWNWHLE